MSSLEKWQSVKVHYSISALRKHNIHLCHMSLGPFGTNQSFKIEISITYLFERNKIFSHYSTLTLDFFNYILWFFFFTLDLQFWLVWVKNQRFSMFYIWRHIEEIKSWYKPGHAQTDSWVEIRNNPICCGNQIDRT